ncbi:MAG: hypothetical protein J7639_16425 [Paenibacillaceae bacterium]|nr:hypothetical protein [Paenibacillaceae bacterium]
MKLFRYVAATLFASALVALLLAFMPGLDRLYRPGGESPAFSPKNHSALGERDLVERLQALPLQLRITRVEWQSSILSVDLLVTPTTMAKDTVYHDMYELSRFGVTDTPNVNQVLVRVLRQPTNSKRDAVLLAALDARRDPDGERAEEADGSGVTDVERYLASRYRVTYTQEWKQFFRM